MAQNTGYGVFVPVCVFFLLALSKIPRRREWRMARRRQRFDRRLIDSFAFSHGRTSHLSRFPDIPECSGVWCIENDSERERLNPSTRTLSPKTIDRGYQSQNIKCPSCTVERVSQSVSLRYVTIQECEQWRATASFQRLTSPRRSSQSYLLCCCCRSMSTCSPCPFYRRYPCEV
jgi:hypothetical protein